MGTGIIMPFQNVVIADDTKLIRFLDRYGAEKSVGTMEHTEINCTFHYGLLSHYQTMETNAGDSQESSTAINLGNGIVGSDTTCNDALVSCWSIWDGNDDPWDSFKESSFAQNKNNVCVITSTVGKVRKIFNQTIEISRKLLGNHFPHIVFLPYDSAITYYPEAFGIEHELWEKMTDPHRYGLGMRTLCNTFHKRDSNGKGLCYAAEKEYRYAMVLGMQRFFGDDLKIALSAEDVMWRDFPLILTDGVHYIDKVYLLAPNDSIEATCYSAKIELVRKYSIELRSLDEIRPLDPQSTILI
ncbi:hypothetical protein [Legionella bozemanae]|uniref:Uncharacterized protein n=1 Tax=Legionella bozemanae TaxID=447 RepID=A0A0W0RXR9_LEGBO|nr:hypothetical protein [Legionella bozemanae]KTC75900.1 hypothetical protein Lboz_0728 [Legionella bozemanae]STO35475.1 Uncharacterised protein [Legionella bozemanae]